MFYGAGNVALFGGSGRDVLIINSTMGCTPYKVVANGGAGDDLITYDRYEGNTALTATGGEGADTFQLLGIGGLETLTITDFAVGPGGDRLDVRYLFNAEMRATDPYTAGVLLLAESGGATVVTRDRDGRAGPETAYMVATVENVTPAGLKDGVVWTDAPTGAAAAPLDLVGQAPDFFQAG